MAPRWSNPSGPLGVNRFRVWPAGPDSYNHAELAANFDKVDAMFGVPPGGGAWPPTEGSNGGLYKLITDLQASVASAIVPVGAMIFWFRPADSVPLPTGFVVADGSTVTKPN